MLTVDRANDGRKYSKMQLSVIVVPIIRSPIINDRQGKMSSTDGSDRQLNITDLTATVHQDSSKEMSLWHDHHQKQ